MSLIDTLCKGGWDVVDPETDERFTRECPLRKKCLRFKARYSVAMIPFFDVVPVRAFMENNPTADKVDCQFYINWN